MPWPKLELLATPQCSTLTFNQRARGSCPQPSVKSLSACAYGRTDCSMKVAHRPYVPRGGHRRRECGPWHAGRGTMETMSKAALCALVLGSTIKAMADLWMRRTTSRGESLARQ